MKNIIFIFRKQLKETLKNKAILIQFIMFPLIGVIMTLSVQLENMPENFFVYLFSSMYITMAPIVSMSSIIAEEKEKNTLRVLLMSNVKAYEFFIGIGGYIFLACMLGSAVFCVLGKFCKSEILYFMVIMAVGILTSIVIGGAIGVASKNQIMNTSITMPVMIVLSFVPMLSQFNDVINNVGRVLYSQQIFNLINNTSNISFKAESIIVIGVNIIISAVLFTVLYKKSRLI